MDRLDCNKFGPCRKIGPRCRIWALVSGSSARTLGAFACVLTQANLGMDLSLAGDLLAAGSALAGLVLVFLGGVLNTYATYDTVQQPAVRRLYKRKGWTCVGGFTLSLAGALFAFLAHAWCSVGYLRLSAGALGGASIVLLILTVVEVWSI